MNNDIIDDLKWFHGIDIQWPEGAYTRYLRDIHVLYGNKEWTFEEFKKKYENGDFKKK